jgi:hypothetical protein
MLAQERGHAILHALLASGAATVAVLAGCSKDDQEASKANSPRPLTWGTVRAARDWSPQRPDP